MEVGLVHNSTTNRLNLLVAYYKAGTGHFMDIYEVTGSTINPVVYSSTMMLSNSPNYGRIRMDCHKLYGVALAWQYPGIGIQTLVGDLGTWSGVTTFSGTGGESGPDVAFSHSSGPLNVHYVYYNNSTGNMTESVFDWSVLLGTPGSVPPIIEDVNFVGAGMALRPVLDCPDHYDAENWAYTYADNGGKILVRYIDYHTAATPLTVAVNSGALGNVPTSSIHKVFDPALHYGNGGIGGGTGQITVGWYATNGSWLNGYMALEMTEDGSGLISAPDYMALPNAFTPSFYPLRKGIAFSKGSDDPLVPPFLYTTFYDLDPGTVLYNLHHAFHKWGMPVFKGGGFTDPHPECGIHARQALAATSRLSAYPNPFRESIQTSVSLEEDGMLQLEMFDLTGRRVWQHQAAMTKGSHQVSTGSLKALAPGTYVLNASLNGKKIGTQKVTRQ